MNTNELYAALTLPGGRIKGMDGSEGERLRSIYIDVRRAELAADGESWSGK